MENPPIYQKNEIFMGKQLVSGSVINQPHILMDTRQQLDLLELEINSSDTRFSYSHRQQLREKNNTRV